MPRGRCKFNSTSSVLGSKTFLGATGLNHPWSSKSQRWMENFRVVNVFKFWSLGLPKFVVSHYPPALASAPCCVSEPGRTARGGDASLVRHTSIPISRSFFLPPSCSLQECSECEGRGNEVRYQRWDRGEKGVHGAGASGWRSCSQKGNNCFPSIMMTWELNDHYKSGQTKDSNIHYPVFWTNHR